MKIKAFEPELLLFCTHAGRTFDISRENTDEDWAVIVKTASGEYDVDTASSGENSLEFVFRSACKGAGVKQPHAWPKKLDKKISDMPEERVDFCIGCGGYKVHDYRAELCQKCEAKE